MSVSCLGKFRILAIGNNKRQPDKQGWVSLGMEYTNPSGKYTIDKILNRGSDTVDDDSVLPSTKEVNPADLAIPIDPAQEAGMVGSEIA